jgi:hypothetical protein
MIQPNANSEKLEQSSWNSQSAIFTPISFRVTLTQIKGPFSVIFSAPAMSIMTVVPTATHFASWHMINTINRATTYLKYPTLNLFCLAYK